MLSLSDSRDCGTPPREKKRRKKGPVASERSAGSSAPVASPLLLRRIPGTTLPLFRPGDKTSLSIEIPEPTNVFPASREVQPQQDGVESSQAPASTFIVVGRRPSSALCESGSAFSVTEGAVSVVKTNVKFSSKEYIFQ